MRHVLAFALCLALAACGSSADPPPDASGEPVGSPEPAPAAEEEGAAPDPPAELDYEAALERLRDELPHDRFTLLVEPPFVVAGDEASDVVRRRAERTVRWAVDLLKKDYFPKDPDRVLRILLFGDDASYRSGAREMFGEEPSTPFGYYSARHEALVMNIGTGGGTLVHEIVHPFVEANFPDCPAWFNEGLGSLYEQCREEDGEIRGSTNWRLAGLQDAIRGGGVPSFETLTSTTTREFYDEDPGTNYAQARYLLYYLQEERLLRTYYRTFHEDAAEDPTGYGTLQRVLGRQDMDRFQREWERWILTLRFP